SSLEDLDLLAEGPQHRDFVLEDRVLAAAPPVVRMDHQDAQRRTGRRAQAGAVSRRISSVTNSTWRRTPALRLACFRWVRTVSTEQLRALGICRVDAFWYRRQTVSNSV